MSVTLNFPALEALLETEQGPVGRDIAQRTERIILDARRRVNIIMARSPVPISQAVDSVQVGTRSIIGIRDQGKIAHYLADKETRELVWLIPSIPAGGFVQA